MHRWRSWVCLGGRGKGDVGEGGRERAGEREGGREEWVSLAPSAITVSGGGRGHGEGRRVFWCGRARRRGPGKGGAPVGSKITFNPFVGSCRRDAR